MPAARLLSMYFLDSPQYAPAFKIIRHRARNLPPEHIRMVEYGQMAQFMHNDVISYWKWKEKDAVAEVKISLLRTAPPPRLEVLYKNSFYSVAIECVPKENAFMNENPRGLFVSEVVRS